MYFITGINAAGDVISKKRCLGYHRKLLTSINTVKRGIDKISKSYEYVVIENIPPGTAFLPPTKEVWFSFSENGWQEIEKPRFAKGIFRLAFR